MTAAADLHSLYGSCILEYAHDAHAYTSLHTHIVMVYIRNSTVLTSGYGTDWKYYIQYTFYKKRARRISGVHGGFLLYRWWRISTRLLTVRNPLEPRKWLKTFIFSQGWNANVEQKRIGTVSPPSYNAHYIIIFCVALASFFFYLSLNIIRCCV